MGGLIARRGGYEGDRKRSARSSDGHEPVPEGTPLTLVLVVVAGWLLASALGLVGLRLALQVHRLTRASLRPELRARVRVTARSPGATPVSDSYVCRPRLRLIQGGGGVCASGPIRPTAS